MPLVSRISKAVELLIRRRRIGEDFEEAAQVAEDDLRLVARAGEDQYVAGLAMRQLVR